MSESPLHLSDVRRTLQQFIDTFAHPEPVALSAHTAVPPQMRGDVHRGMEKALKSNLGSARQAVTEEIVAHWQQEGKLTHPMDVYNHLINKRVDQGTISHERAQLLQAAFADTFAPEQSTGYHAKHREELMEGLARLYVEKFPSASPVHNIKADISNLGGLNKAMEDAALKLSKENPSEFERLLRKHGITVPASTSTDEEQLTAAARLGKRMADRVMHHMCSITKAQIDGVCKTVLDTRIGGDELGFMAQLKDGVTPEMLEIVYRQAQRANAQFIGDTKLLIEHAKDLDLKEEHRRLGTGLGLGSSQLTPFPTTNEQQTLSGLIGDSKDVQQDFIRRIRQTRQGDESRVQTPSLTEIDAALESSLYASHTVKTHPIGPELNVVQSIVIPDAQRENALLHALEKAGQTPLSPQEEHLAIGTFNLLRRNDPVTKLPMFENMQQDQLPYFIHQHAHKTDSAGKKVGTKLVHVDFGMATASGNALSEDIGDATIRHARDTTLKSLHRSGLGEFTAYVAAQPGSKFTILVPGNTSDETLQTFYQNLQQELARSASEPLRLSPEALAEAQAKFSGDEKVRSAYGQRTASPFDDQGNISVARLVNPKTKLSGATVSVAWTPGTIDTDRSLGDQLFPLEQANVMQQRRTIDAGRAEIGMPPMPVPHSSRLREQRSAPDTSYRLPRG